MLSSNLSVRQLEDTFILEDHESSRRWCIWRRYPGNPWQLKEITRVPQGWHMVTA